jgi:hypothetical protein
MEEPSIVSSPPSSMLAPQSEIQDPINRLAGFREGEPPGEPLANPARTEPRPPKITKSHLSKIDRGGDSGRENRTTEANSDEMVIIIQNQHPVAVAANLSVDSGLDKRAKQSGGATGGPSADLSVSAPGLAELPRPHDEQTKRSGSSSVNHGMPAVRGRTDRGPRVRN